jgi:putative transposase
MLRSYKLRLRPTAKQRLTLEGILALSCDLYNAALQERRDAWNTRRENIDCNHQQKELTEIRADDVEVRAIAVDIAREPLRRVDRAFKAFFRRCKLGQKPGYPRFKAKARYSSFTFGRVQIKNNVLMIPNLGGVRFKTTQSLTEDLRTATIKRNGKKWEARIICDIGEAPEKKAVSSAIGIDLGLTNFVTLSNGDVIDNPRWTREHAERVAKANRSLSRKKRGSNNRLRAKAVLSRTYQRAADARRNFTHHVSKWLVQSFDLIAYEKLNIAGMARSNLAKSILDAAWGELLYQLRYKAESAGTYAIAVNPRNTTIDCSGCGEKVPKTLAERTHSCPTCGLILDRDHNAAINILALGVSAAGASLQNIPRVV